MNKSWSSPQEQSIFPLLIIMCNFHIFRRTWPQHPFYYMPQYTHSVLLSGWNAIIMDDGLISPSCSTALLFIISFFFTPLFVPVLSLVFCHDTPIHPVAVLRHRPWYMPGSLAGLGCGQDQLMVYHDTSWWFLNVNLMLCP